MSPGIRTVGRITLLAACLVVFAVAAGSCGGGSDDSSGGDGGDYYVPSEEEESFTEESFTDESFTEEDVPSEPGESDTMTSELLVQRTTVGASPSLSLECYSFSDSGEVELRHNGSTDVSDVGQYYGDTSGGEIEWNSGNTSTVEYDGTSYYVNGAQAAEIDSCLEP